LLSRPIDAIFAELAEQREGAPPSIVFSCIIKFMMHVDSCLKYFGCSLSHAAFLRTCTESDRLAAVARRDALAAADALRRRRQAEQVRLASFTKTVCLSSFLFSPRVALSISHASHAP
jgi:hypothetical protein